MKTEDPADYVKQKFIDHIYTGRYEVTQEDDYFSIRRLDCDVNTFTAYENIAIVNVLDYKIELRYLEMINCKSLAQFNNIGSDLSPLLPDIQRKILKHIL